MKPIGVIGAGNMGSAIIRGMLEAGYVKASGLYVYDASPAKLSDLSGDWPGLQCCESAHDLAAQAEIIVLAVKPNVVQSVIDEIRDDVAGKAVISIAAGWTTSMLDAAFAGSGASWLRVMPNTPAQVGEGMTAICREHTLSDADLEIARGIFDAVGRTAVLPESMFDGVIAVSGSSPAYVYMMIEAMGDAAVREGIPRAQAYEMAAQAVLGSALMVLSTKEHPAKLKDAVCSPAGTTIDAVAALEKGGFRTAIMDAMAACAEKSRRMSSN